MAPGTTKTLRDSAPPHDISVQRRGRNRSSLIIPLWYQGFLGEVIWPRSPGPAFGLTFLTGHQCNAKVLGIQCSAVGFCSVDGGHTMEEGPGCGFVVVWSEQATKGMYSTSRPWSLVLYMIPSQTSPAQPVRPASLPQRTRSRASLAVRRSH